MTQQVRIELNDDVEAKLLELPSATTPGERQLALHYTAAYWDGQGSVFENGPLLGGATRALAMGMLHKEGRRKDALLHTYDWFSLREPLDLPEDVWPSLVSRGLLTDEEIADAHAKGTFLPLLESLHRQEDYWPLVRPHVGYLPGHRDDVPQYGEHVFSIGNYMTGQFSLAFIDGCKSWYGTKHWFREIVPHFLPDTDIMFQDFGHRTCFWLPSLIWTFREHFELIAYVDMTYVWRLKSAPSQVDIEKSFPDEPIAWDKAAYDEVFDGLMEEAVQRNDRWEMMVLQAQRGASYAYIGLEDEAREVLDKLLMVAEYVPYRAYLKEARRYPTYTPEGPILL